ncbi:MAG: hypothetical protein GX248_09070 [Peptococcaceae bacterium]|jgi:hypothetical protein|nr:hypothetical protein [Peptococcaceae bacterium]
MQDNLTKIKAKLLELATLVKDQTMEETKGVRDEILKNVNEMKTVVEERFQGVQEKYGDNIQEFWGDLEDKALKVQEQIQEKLSYGLSHRNEIIDKTADSLIEVITKAKKALQAKEK